MRMRTVGIATIAAVMLLAGCGPKDDQVSSSEPSSDVAPESRGREGEVVTNVQAFLEKRGFAYIEASVRNSSYKVLPFGLTPNVPTCSFKLLRADVPYEKDGSVDYDGRHFISNTDTKVALYLYSLKRDGISVSEEHYLGQRIEMTLGELKPGVIKKVFDLSKCGDTTLITSRP